LIRNFVSPTNKQIIDERVSDGFAQLKPTLPFGQLPVLEVNGIVIPQSVAITRYLAREHGLYGK
jgi:glutathione S-transferase